MSNLVRANEPGDAVRVMIDFVARAWERTRDVNATLDDLAIVQGLARGAWAAQHSRWRAEALRHAGCLDEATALALNARKTFAALHDEFHEAQCLRLLGHIASERGAPRGGRKLVAEARGMMSELQAEWGRAQCDVVLGELDYLLGDHASAVERLENALGPLDRAQDILGRGQCLILLALIRMGQNDCERARRHLIEARQGFDRIGYRLGTAQCDVALAHADHRSGEIDSARARAQNALASFRMLGTPRGQSGALRVMAMAAIDAGDLVDAEQRARDARELYERIGDPWGLVESQLLLVQVSLAGGSPDARERLQSCDISTVQEHEPLQHWHLTHAWLACKEGRFEDALGHLEAAKQALQGGGLADHALQLTGRLALMPWPEALRPRVKQALMTEADTVPPSFQFSRTARRSSS
ncbi:MAG: hypothetical protein MUF54_22285 [Polyangiaceae bacterium]|nr:hypothetical protein [Polyangiaceae bacterium]